MQRIFFFHIPKTAGTSVSQFFLRQLPRENVFIGGPYTAPLKVIKNDPSAPVYYAAHMAYDEYLNMDFRHRSFTFLRDPRKRLVSSYYFVRNSRAEEGRMSEQAKATRRYDLADWLQYCLDAGATKHGQNNGNDNFYARIMLGRGSVVEIPRLDLAPDGPEMALIRQRLRQFECVGLVEEFPTSLAMIARALDLSPPEDRDLVPRNRAADTDKTPREPITDKMNDAITELCRYDQWIYDYGKTLFEQQQKAYPAP